MRSAARMLALWCAMLVAWVSQAGETVRVEFNGMAAGVRPQGWSIKGTRRGVPESEFKVVEVEGGRRVLRMKAEKGCGGVLREIKGVDLRKTPVMRWRWRAGELPRGGDGRVEERADQAVHLYVLSGGLFAQRCVSYTWETETPRGASEHFSLYLGVFEDRWWCLRNKADGTNVWYTETRDVAADFTQQYGSVPSSIAVMIFCKADMTGTRAEAAVDWIEFVAGTNSVPAAGDKET